MTNQTPNSHNGTGMLLRLYTEFGRNGFANYDVAELPQLAQLAEATGETEVLRFHYTAPDTTQVQYGRVLVERLDSPVAVPRPRCTHQQQPSVIHDGQELPNPKTVSAHQLGTVLQNLGAIGLELEADLVTEEFRLQQYRRVTEIAEWVTQAADSLHYTLDRETNPDQQLED